MRSKPRRPTLLAPLPPRLLHAWQAELTGTGVDARAHWWAMPHWVPRKKLLAGAAPLHHELLADTVRHCSMFSGELDASFGGVEMWVQKRAASAAMHLHWDMDEERVRCATAGLTHQQASPTTYSLPPPTYSPPPPTVSRLRRQLCTPLVSIVVYLGDAGGPTLVLAQVRAAHALCSCAACALHVRCMRNARAVCTLRLPPRRCQAHRATDRAARGAFGRTQGRRAAATCTRGR